MHDLIFLSHRIPFPPDKGEKIRAWHIFRHLARTHRMHLGCFIDDPADWAHLAELRPLCADVACFGINRTRRKLHALARLRPGQPLTLGYFADARLRRWTDAKRAAGIGRAFVYCSAMAPYLFGAHGMRRVLDMVDMDSAKWGDFADRAPWPASAVWRREARTLLALERRAALDYDHTLFVSRAEAADFARAAPEAADRVGWLDNGVDLAFFAAADFARPFPPGATLVFTGTMDYWPNVDAMTWLAEAVLPRLRAARPDLRLCIVGANPVAAVQRLADDPAITVTGRVADVRPYLAHADVVVAPLRIARGIQNKVLEAMAMARPVVATPQAFAGLRAVAGRDLLLGADAAGFAACVGAVLDGRHPGLGTAARACVVASYAWSATLAGLDALFDSPPDRGVPALARFRTHEDAL
jgi:sugar transferase (PEP-CTERM/EpsH1 system associated)